MAGGRDGGDGHAGGAYPWGGKRRVHHHPPPTNGARVGGWRREQVSGPRSRRDLCVRRVDTLRAGARSAARWGGGARPSQAAEGRSSLSEEVRGPPRPALDRSRRAPQAYYQNRGANGGRPDTAVGVRQHNGQAPATHGWVRRAKRHTAHLWVRRAKRHTAHVVEKENSTAGCKADGGHAVKHTQPHQAASPHSPSRGAHVAQKEKWSGHRGSPRPA